LYKLLQIQDFFIIPLILLVVYAVSTRIKNKNIEEYPYYKYFRIGLFAKILGGFVFVGVYLFYYGGGDTISYYFGSQNITNMLGKSVPTFFKLLKGDLSEEVYSMFDRNTGWPAYFIDPNAFAVCRYNTLFYILGLGSYVGNTIVMNAILYSGLWRFYKMLVDLHPSNSKLFAFALFFIPSIIFWGSGILKDGWTFTAILFTFTNFYQIFIIKKKIIKNILWVLFWSYISFSIRPYVFYATIGSGFVWVAFASIQSIHSTFLKTIALPFILIASWVAGTLIITKTGALAGNRYSSIDAMLETAWIIQDDLKRDYYGGNSFNIGEFEPTIPGVLSKAPIAIASGLFRPFLWEGKRTILMTISGIENLLLLLIIVYVLLKLKFIFFFKLLFKDPLMIALFTLSITFAFSVGLTTSNFGALVRYAIPAKGILIIVFSYMLNEINLYYSQKKKENT
jgi:hypothetical protein